MPRVAEVAFPLPLHQTFDYLIPEGLAAQAGPGGRVRAQFGPRRMTGFLVSFRDAAATDRPLKEIEAAEPPLGGAEMLELARWMSKRYCAPLGECLSAVLPKYVRGAVRGDQGSVLPPPGSRTAPAYELTAEQASALSSLSGLVDAGGHSAAVLLGVPASGKTEIYLRLLDRVTSEGGQALFLVPEIALTHPFLEEISGRVGVPVVSWHSKGSPAAKRRAWLALAEGRPAVVVGARSASLVPLPKLRLAVVDEEQDASYKQDGAAPHYHARQVALERARKAGAVALLGSATPSLESYRRAAEGDWPLLKLPRGPHQAPKPSVRILDRRLHPGDLFCPELTVELKKALEEKEQAILVVNRRGHSSLTICQSCGWLAKCERCGIAMVLHQSAKGPVLRCHHCEAVARPPETCPKCGKPGVRHAGAGTQKAAVEAADLAPGARVLRFDRDTVQADKDGGGLYRRFKKLEADVMVGTQLVSKGYHFPEVTLVGIVDADAMLHFPDFRAAEKTFQLLVQAAGRAGRAQKAGRVILQTLHPDHYAILAAAEGDYEAFAKKELEFRKELGYPPYGGLFRVLVTGLLESRVIEAADEIGASLRASLASNGLEVLGPAPAYYGRLRGRFRHHLLVKAKQPGAVPSVHDALRSLKPPSGVQVKVQVDPYDLL